jgi:sulfur transfer complex TusBCD TusB component (DsrH family)
LAKISRNFLNLYFFCNNFFFGLKYKGNQFKGDDKMTSVNLSEKTLGGIEKFMAEMEEAKKISPEMQELQNKSLNLLKNKAKKRSIEDTLAGLKALEDEDVEVLETMLDKVQQKEKESQEILKSAVKDHLSEENKDDFVKIAKMTRFSTSVKEVDAASFASKKDEVVRKIGENVNEQILKTHTTEFVDMLKDEKHESIARFVEMHKKREVAVGIANWIDAHITNEVLNNRTKEQFEELHPEFVNFLPVCLHRLQF